MARKRSDDKRRRILQAAVKVFARKGYFAARVAEIAQRAGVADGTIYLYFRGKEDILVSLFDELMAEHVERAREEMQAVEDAPSRLRLIAEHHLRALGADRDLAVVFQVELRQSTKFMERFTASWLGRYFDLVGSVIEQGQREGTLRADVPRKLVTKAFFGTLDELVTSWVIGRKDYDLALLAGPAVDLLLRGAAAANASASGRRIFSVAARRGRPMKMPTRTLCEIFYHSVDTYRKADHLRAKRGESWGAISSEEFRRAVEELSMGLRALGVEKGDRVALLSENRPEWAYVDLATLCAAAVDVPIYPNLPPAQVLYVLNDSQAKVAIASTAAQVKKVTEVRAKAPHLKHVIRFDDPPQEGTLSLDEVRARGREALAADRDAVKRRAAEVTPESLATLIYTSGTTGDPKGVMLTHDNIVSNVHGALAAFGDFGPSDVALSFLPLCHIFERMGGHYLMLQQGVTIAYAESVEKVPANMTEVRPTLMLSVPRLYEKMYARIREKVAAKSALAQGIFRWALGVGRQVFQAQIEHRTPGPLLRARHALADRLVFKDIRERTGGRLRLFVSGGAPLAREIGEFFGAVGLIILEGYGLTETSPVIAVNRPDRMKPGSVGPPLHNVEVKIAEDGEILTRGPHVMQGYYNKPEATAEAIDQDRWFHTGDVGIIDAEGFLVITDRKKDIIVTSGGKKIAPQPIENVMKTNPLIGEIVMIGNKRNFPSALIVPNFDNLQKWAREHGVSAASAEDLVRDARVVALYDQTIKELTKDLAQFERIKKIALLPREFTLEAGELTPTLKVKRKVVEQKYKDVIDRLYEDAAA